MAPDIDTPGVGIVDQLAAALSGGGWTVLPQRLPADLVATLRDAFLPLIESHAGANGPNRGTRRYQLYVPFEPPFSDPALWADPTVLAVVEGVLGPGFECTYFGSDTPFPGAEHQPVHQDGGPLFPEWEARVPPYAIALNVPLVDVDERNGPIELFAGPGQPDPDAEPIRITAPAGTCLLRDTRIWHRGSPNVGDAPRPMLALLYTRPWYRFPLDRPALSRAVYERLQGPGRRLFRGADITPRHAAPGDRPRLAEG